MKFRIGLFVVLLGLSIWAQTNVIELNNRAVEFRDLKGKDYKVELVRATLDGIIYSVPGGGGMIRYSDLSPETLIEWGIPTNRIAIAAQRMEAKKRAKDAFNAQGEAGAFQRSLNVAVGQATTAYRQRRQAAESKLKAAENKVKSIQDLLTDVKAQRDYARDRYVNTHPSATSASTTLDGRVYIDNDTTRRATAQALDARASELEEQLAQAQKELEAAKTNYTKELQQIEQDYNSQMQSIQAASRGSAPVNSDNPEQ